MPVSQKLHNSQITVASPVVIWHHATQKETLMTYCQF